MVACLIPSFSAITNVRLRMPREAQAEPLDVPHLARPRSLATMPPAGGTMPKIEVRPGLTMAYEDDCFAAPWSAPETVVLVHGNCESSRAWTQWVPLVAGRYRVVRLDMPGFGASTA